MKSVIGILIACVVLFSCAQNKSAEQKKKEATQRALDKAQKIAAPLIADQVGDLNILVSNAQNKNLSDDDRGNALNKLRNLFPEYMTSAIDLHKYSSYKPYGTSPKEILRQMHDTTQQRVDQRLVFDSAVFSDNFNNKVAYKNN
jgi:hypothetical protein